ncbi:MAG: hypothetical protein JXQ96_10235 [Cyclobacteriaceae bacterium]
MKITHFILHFSVLSIMIHQSAVGQVSPDQINFVRQGVQRLIFDEGQSIPLAKLDPKKIVGMASMHPVKHYSQNQAAVIIEEDKMVIKSESETRTAIWFAGFNPFATYSINLESCRGKGEVGFKFSDASDEEQFFVKIGFSDSMLTGVKLKVVKNTQTIVDESIKVNPNEVKLLKGKIILQMLGSGFTLYLENQGLPKVIGQSDFNKYIDLRDKLYLGTFQSHIYVQLNDNSQLRMSQAEMALTTGVGLADIRAITYENGDPLLDQGRLWYTMSIRGRALPHHIQGVFSMNPTVFDIKLEGIIVFDRENGILRNEIASHLFFDRADSVWRGLTTGFSAYANPKKEKKQLLAIESERDPRFGFSIMKSIPFGMIGDIEDPHILFDPSANKWRMLTCENNDGYKAIVLESKQWNQGYKRIAGPVSHNSTGTSIQKIGDKLYCLSGSSERKIFIYSYPDLKESGTLKMDLPPWDETSRTRVWPNVVQLPDGYPFKYVALMMDRYNYPGLNGPNWSYGALYLYHGYIKN